MKQLTFIAILLVWVILSGCRENDRDSKSSDTIPQPTSGVGQSSADVPSPPRPTIFGKWKVVQGWPETLELGADGTFQMESSGEKCVGIFSHSFPKLEFDVDYLGSLKKVSFTVAFLSDSDLVLRSALKNFVTGRTFKVYKRVLPGQPEPELRDLKMYRKSLQGSWGCVGGNEVLKFNAKGLFSAVNANQPGLSGVFTVNDDDLQLSANTPKGIRRLQFAIIELNPEEMHLLSENNVRIVYRRKS
jgi:hypothetical protein